MALQHSTTLQLSPRDMERRLGAIPRWQPALHASQCLETSGTRSTWERQTPEQHEWEMCGGAKRRVTDARGVAHGAEEARGVGTEGGGGIDDGAQDAAGAVAHAAGVVEEQRGEGVEHERVAREVPRQRIVQPRRRPQHLRRRRRRLLCCRGPPFPSSHLAAEEAVDISGCE